MRRPRVSLANSHSGGAGAPPGGTTAPCLEQADCLGPKCPGESAARRRKENAAVERREASALRYWARAERRKVERLAALRHPSLWRGV